MAQGAFGCLGYLMEAVSSLGYGTLSGGGDSRCLRG